jgi:putative FmdB family regulatory protein
MKAAAAGCAPSLALDLTRCQTGHTPSLMPTYEYGCDACGNEWEQVQRITEAAIDLCPKCGKTAAHRLISAGTNFILKGGGWYSDLYSSSKPASKTEASGAISSDSGTTTESTTSTSTTTETKAETKTEAKAPAASPSPPATSSS